MFWSFEVNQLLTKDRIGQMQREADRARLAKLAAAGRSGESAPTDRRARAAPGAGAAPWPRDRRAFGLEQGHSAPAFSPVVPADASTFGPDDQPRRRRSA